MSFWEITYRLSRSWFNPALGGPKQKMGGWGYGGVGFGRVLKGYPT